MKLILGVISNIKPELHSKFQKQWNDAELGYLIYYLTVTKKIYRDLLKTSSESNRNFNASNVNRGCHFLLTEAVTTTAS